MFLTTCQLNIKQDLCKSSHSKWFKWKVLNFFPGKYGLQIARMLRLKKEQPFPGIADLHPLCKCGAHLKLSTFPSWAVLFIWACAILTWNSFLCNLKWHVTRETLMNQYENNTVPLVLVSWSSHHECSAGPLNGRMTSSRARSYGSFWLSC